MSSKKLALSIITILTVTPVTHAQDHWAKYIAVKTENREYSVFAENVNIRKAPDTKAAVEFQLQPGDRVRVLKKQTALSDMGGTKEYWYLIDTGGKKGYVWGGLLADGTFALQGKTVLVRNLGVKKSRMEMRLMEGKRTLDRLEWKSGPASNDQELGLKIIPAKGFTNPPDQIFSISYFVYSEIEVGHTSYQLFTLSREGKLTEQFSWSPGGCDPPSCGETTMLFPGDSLKADVKTRRTAYRGAPDRILKIHHGYDMDDAASHNYSVQEYLWDGAKFKLREE